MARTMEIEGFEVESASEALQWTNAGGGEAISIGNKYIVTTKAEAERIAATGVFFAYLFDQEMPDGSFRIMSVPVND